MIFAASRFFVGQLGALGPYLGLKPQLLSLLVSPIATELPETLNAVIWIRQGKVRLALANISGAMMIQATVPTAFGLFATPWVLDPALILAGAVTLLSVSILFFAFWRGWITRTYLALMSLAYVAFGADHPWAASLGARPRSTARRAVPRPACRPARRVRRSRTPPGGRDRTLSGAGWPTGRPQPGPAVRPKARAWDRIA